MAAIVPYGSITNTYAHYVCGDADGTWYEASNWEYCWNGLWNCPCYYNNETGEMVWTLSQTGAEVRHGASSWILPADCASPDLMICDVPQPGAEQPDVESWDWQQHWSEQWLCVLYYNHETDGIVFAPDDPGPQSLEDVAREVFGAMVLYNPQSAADYDADSDTLEPAEEPEALAIADAEETEDASVLAIADAEATGDEVVSTEPEEAEAAEEEALAIADAEEAADASTTADAKEALDELAMVDAEAAADAPVLANADVAAARDEEVPVPDVAARVQRVMPAPLEAEADFARATSSQSWPDFESEPEVEAMAYVPRRTPAKAHRRQESYFKEPESPEVEESAAQLPKQTPAREMSRQSYFSDVSSPEVSLVSALPVQEGSFDNRVSEDEDEVPAEVPEPAVAQKPKRTRRRISRHRPAEAAEAEPAKASEEIVPAASQEIVPAASEAIVPAASEAIVPATSQEIVPAMSEAIVPSMSEAIVPVASEEIVPYQGLVAEEVQWFNEELERQRREYESLQEVVTVLTEREQEREAQTKEMEDKVAREMAELRLQSEEKVEQVTHDMEEIRTQHASEMAELRAELRKLAEENRELRQCSQSSGRLSPSPAKGGRTINAVPRPLVSSSPRPSQRSGSLPRAGTVPVLVSSFSGQPPPATQGPGAFLPDWLSLPLQSARPSRRRSRGADA